MRFWLALGIVGLLGIYGYMMFLNQPKLSDSPQEVRLSPDPVNPQMTEVFLSDITSHAEKKLFTLSDVYHVHYHPAEFVNGNIYIVKRPRGPEASLNSASWTDELWEYSQAGNGKKIYSEPGLDFRVSAEAQRIAIFASIPDQKLTIADLEGERKKEFLRKDIPDFPEGAVLSPLMWHGQVVWFGATEGLSLIRLFSLDAISGSMTSYDLSGLGATREDSALDPASRLFVYSDYRPRLDTGDPTRQMATLFVYDLAKRKKISLISASVTRAFEPKWIDGTMVEYNDPSGTGRVQMRLSSF